MCVSYISQATIKKATHLDLSNNLLTSLSVSFLILLLSLSVILLFKVILLIIYFRVLLLTLNK